jgi:hypothetical protein
VARAADDRYTKEGGRSPSGWLNRRKREVRRWCSPVNQGGGREQIREQGGAKGGGGGKGNSVAQHARFIVVRGSGRRRCGGGDSG